jgi:hypothetical protein
MTTSDAPWFDDDAGPLVRPYAVTRGRTMPSQFLEMVTLVVSVSTATDVPGPEHRRILALCHRPLSVAEVAATVNLPIGAVKVLISDLIELDAMVMRTADNGYQSLDRELIRTVINGIRRL